MQSDCTGTQREVISDAIKDVNSVLDVGCGNGEKTFFISQRVKQVVGIDPDEQMLKVAQANFLRQNLLFQLGKGESLNFPSSSFGLVLLNESLHHIPFEKQTQAMNEAWRVLEPEGKMLVIEPIYGKGTFEKISRYYNDEQKSRQSAIQTIEAAIGVKFNLALKKEIHIECSCNGFDDLYQNEIKARSLAKWNIDNKENIVNVLAHCSKTPAGDFIIDYFSTVWLLLKKGN